MCVCKFRWASPVYTYLNKCSIHKYGSYFSAPSLYIHGRGGQLIINSLCTVNYKPMICKMKNRIGNIVKSQNIVEQANSNSNNTSLTISRQLIILNASVLTNVNQ